MAHAWRAATGSTASYKPVSSERDAHKVQGSKRFGTLLRNVTLTFSCLSRSYV